MGGESTTMPVNASGKMAELARKFDTMSIYSSEEIVGQDTVDLVMQNLYGCVLIVSDGENNHRPMGKVVGVRRAQGLAVWGEVRLEKTHREFTLFDSKGKTTPIYNGVSYSTLIFGKER